MSGIFLPVAIFAAVFVLMLQSYPLPTYTKTAIYFFGGTTTTTDGLGEVSKNIVCLSPQKPLGSQEVS